MEHRGTVPGAARSDASGAIDDRTADVINRSLAELGALGPDGPEPLQQTVGGQVVGPDGEPFAGSVILFQETADARFLSARRDRPEGR